MNSLLTVLNQIILNESSWHLIGPFNLSSTSEQTLVLTGPKIPLGTLFFFKDSQEKLQLLAYLYQYKEDRLIALLLNKNLQLREFNSSIFATTQTLLLNYSSTFQGCLINPLGKIVKRMSNSANQNPNKFSLPYKQSSPPPCDKKLINEIFFTGLGAIDIFNTVGYGQKIVILAEPGVGKTALITNLAKNSAADINIIALVGERGREITEFISSLSPETLKHSIIIMSTSDDPAALRVLAVEAAISIAEFYREQGFKVLLQIDSLSRFLRAFREISLELGELPITNGYSAAIYPTIASLLERLGNSKSGSITTFLTLLSSAEIIEEPLVKEIISLTDGHLLLTKALAREQIYPAIDLNNSLSRLQNKLIDSILLKKINNLRSLILEIQKAKSLFSLGIKLSDKLQAAMEMETELFSLYQKSFFSLKELETIVDSFDKKLKT